MKPDATPSRGTRIFTVRRGAAGSPSAYIAVLGRTWRVTWAKQVWCKRIMPVRLEGAA